MPRVRIQRVAIAAIALASLGCRQLLGFEGVAPGDGPPIVPDAGPCQELTSTCAGEDTLRTCVTLGELPIDSACPWGCLVDGGAHCARLSPSGGAAVADDLDPAELSQLADMIAVGTLSTDDGRLNGVAMPNVEVLIRGTVTILRVNRFRVAGSLALTGSNALAILADGEISIEGVIDVRGSCQDNTAGPGGFAGGAVNLGGAGPGGGAGGSQTNGGGGGGHGGVGGTGGSTGGNITEGGVANGDAAITMLVGGGGGGGGSDNSSNTGGGGGGALQLVSNGAIVIDEDGGINAGGCGPSRTNCPTCTSGGGGAGGAILLEALSISIFGALAVNGGGGSGSGGQGEDGRLDRTPAQGGSEGNGGPGGDGGAGPSLDGQPAPSSDQRPGGGGGAVGRIRLHTRDGTVDLAPGVVLSPDLDDSPTTATAASAPTQ